MSSLSVLPVSASRPPLSIYLHIPYCRSKCLYCDFNSHPVSRPPWEAYLQAVLGELEGWRGHEVAGRPLGTLFLGGGTPSLFPPTFFAELLPAIWAKFPPLPDVEVTLEANPGTLQPGQLAALQRLGVNRLSIGVQSVKAAHLRTLTRLHGVEEAREAVWQAQTLGFADVSVDLMFGIPGQSLTDWEEELREVRDWPLTHLSAYNLTPEEGTALVKALEAGRLALPDEDILVAEYGLTRRLLREVGLEPYEISNYARGRPCRHNLVYWKGGDYLGLGAGAHSYLQGGAPPPGWEAALSDHEGGASEEGAEAGDKGWGLRWWNVSDPAAYLARAQGAVVDALEWLTLEQAASELILTRLRLAEGLSLAELERRFGPRARQAVESRAAGLCRDGLLEAAGGWLRLTDAGVLVANAMIASLDLALEAGLRAGRRGRKG